MQLPTAEQEPPPVPAAFPHLERLLWYDLSPMRPDAFRRQTAIVWLEAQQVQNAYRDGVEDAKAEVTNG